MKNELSYSDPSSLVHTRQNKLKIRTLSLLQAVVRRKKISLVSTLRKSYSFNYLFPKGTIVLLFMLLSISGMAQSFGEYRTAGGGNWSNINTWQRYNGSSWVTPNNTTEGYPGQFNGNMTVTIRAGHAVDIEVSPSFAIGTLNIGTTGVDASLRFNSGVARVLTVTNNINVVDGSFAITNGSGAKTHVLNIGGNLTVPAGSTFDMTASGDDNSSVIFNTAAASIISGGSTPRFFNLTINKTNNANTVTSTGVNFGITNNLTVTRGVLSLQATSGNYNVDNDVSVSTNGTINHNVDWDVTGRSLNITGSLLIDGIYTYSNRAMVIMNGSGRNIRTGTNALSALSLLTVTNGNKVANGTVRINHTLEINLTTGNRFEVNGNPVTVSDGIRVMGGVLRLNGGTLTVTNDLIVGTGTGNGIFDLSTGTFNTDDFILGNGTRTGVVNHSGGTANVTGNVVINTGCEYRTTNSPSLNISGNFTNIGSFTAATGTVTFNGTNAQQIIGTTATTFYNLTNTNTHVSGISLSINTTVANNITLSSTTEGKIFTGSNSLILTKALSGTALTGANTSRYIVGNLRYMLPAGNTNGLVYHVGSASAYAPLTLTINSVSGNLGITAFTATSAPANENNPSTNSSGINQSLKCANYWQLSRNGSGTFTNYDVTFDFTNTVNSGVTNNYRLRQFSSSWLALASNFPTVTTIRSTGLTSVGEFTFGVPNTAPVVTADPVNFNLCAVGTVTFTAAVSSVLPAPTVRWQRNSGSGFVDITTANMDGTPSYSGFTSNTLTINNADISIDNYTYRAVYTNINGTSISGFGRLNAAGALISYTGTPFCSNTNSANVTQTGIGGGTYSGSAGLVIDANTGTVDLQASTAGTHIVTYTYNNGSCSGSTNTSIVIRTSPVVTIAANHCYGNGYVQLTATAGASYLWNTGATSQSILVDVATNFFVTVTAANGCTGSDAYSTGTELVTNGDFEQGNTGFFTLYTYTNSAAGLYPESYYGVGDNANFYHSNFFGTDHTSGSGNFMIVNGASNNRNVWQQTINVAPNTTYYFSAYAMSVNNVSPFAELQFAVNNQAVGSIAYLAAGPSSTSGPFNWIRFYGTWNSGSNTTATINVIDLQTAAGGNDFGLDDISFSTLSPVSFGVVTAAGSVRCNQQPLNLFGNITGGSSPFTYTWTGPGGFSSNQQNPVISSANNSNNGTYTLSVTDRFGCAVTDDIDITINPSPVNRNLQVTPATICGSGTATIDVVNSENGVNYQLRNNAGNVNIGSPLAGGSNPLSISSGVITATTTFNVLATLGTCNLQMTDLPLVTVNPLPNNIAPTAQAASICNGTGTNIRIGGSQTGVTYQLRNDANDANIGSPVAGNGGTINLPTGNLTATTTFNVLATISATGCIREMSTTVTVTVQPLPNNLTPAASPAAICSGNGSNIQITNSQSGVNYQLRNNSNNSNVGSAVSGNGGTINLPTGNLTTTTTYNVLATNSSTGCNRQMSTTVTVTVNGLPNNINPTITTGTFCVSGSSNVQIAGSQTGVNYQLRDNATNASIGFAVAGTGGTINLPTGTITSTTVFNVLATNATTSCVRQMNNTVTLTINPLPTSLTPVAQNSNICVSGSTNIQIANSQSGVRYQLRNNANNANIGSTVNGNGATIDLPTGTISTTMTYNITATVITTGCNRVLTPLVTVNVNPALATNTISGNQSICSGSNATTLTGSTPTGGNGSFTYLWESSTTSASAGFGTAAGTSNGINYSPGTVSVPTWYRRTVTSGGCTNTSSTVQVTMLASGLWVGGSTGNWNVAANWCGGIPTNATNVTIPAGSTVTINGANAVANNITISNTASLVMTGSNNLTITSGGTFSNSGSFNASGSTGRVIFDGNGTISGTTAFQNIDTRGALNFGTASTVNGTFRLLTGGSVTGNGPTYNCPAATLQYSTTGTFVRGLEWGSGSSGAGYPANVIVDNNTTINFPANGNGFVCNDLTIESGSSLRQNHNGGSASLQVGRHVTISGTLSLGSTAGGDLALGGNWTRNNGAIFNHNERMVTFNGPANFSNRGTSMATITAPASPFKDNEGGFGGEQFAHVWMNKSTAADSVVLLSNITVTRQIGFTRGTFSLRNSDVTIVSNETRTADVAPITNTANVNIRYTGTGLFNIQRYVPNPTNVRAWRLVTAPVQAATAPTINQAWQYGTVNPDRNNPTAADGAYDPWPGFGTHITGPNGAYNAANGWDQGTRSGSLLQANSNVTTWTSPASTTGTRVTDQPGWMLFVRGDRSFQIGNQYVPAQNTVLETRGRINVGNVSRSLVAGRQLVGNPYASAINLTNVNIAGVSGGNSSYHVWDPKMFTSYTQPGKWVSFTGVGSSFVKTTSGSAYDLNGTIQSGQAFVVDAASAGNIVFTESNKLPLTNSLEGISSRPMGVTTANQYPLLRADVYVNSNEGYKLTDAVASVFGDGFDNTVGADDAKKVITFNTRESFSIIRDSIRMAIEKRNTIVASDTIFYTMSRMNPLAYQIRFEASDFDNLPLTAYLEDLYKGTASPVSLSGVTTVPFDITSDSASYRADRFRVVFKQAQVLPVTFASINAWQQASAHAIQWQVAGQQQIVKYVVERSADGRDFMAIATQAAAANSNSHTYMIYDEQPISGCNFYRVRSVGLNGESLYSSTVKLCTDKRVMGITLLNNPVVNGTVLLQFQQMPTGRYQVQMHNASGQLIKRQVVNHAGGNSTLSVKADQALAAGTYHIEITQPDGKKIVLQAMYP